MKRTALKRKTPLRPMSAKKKAMQPSYRKAYRDAMYAQLEEKGNTYCEKCLSASMVEPHHTQGRIGENLLIFKLLCGPCHDFIHSNPKIARSEGWLK